MGIFIHLAIAKSVTKKEWQDVYEESLKLVSAFPFAEKRTVNIDGIDTICLTKTKERETTYGWNGEKTSIGWETVGDYQYMHTAEDYYLPRDLVKDEKYTEKCEDAMFGVFPTYLGYDWKDERFDFIYNKWGNKTQGEPYHIYLLAVACLIESRLGRKAFVYGDITRGQCVKAVQLANEVLDIPVKLPDRCNPETLAARINTMPITEIEKIHAFEAFYLGNKEKEFGEQFQKIFSSSACDAYWKNRFGQYRMGQMGFDSAFNDYLLWGFDLYNVCKYVCFEDSDEVPQYEAFVKRVMDAKLHWEEKDCSDPLKIDQDESRPFSIYTYLAQFAFAGAYNKKIDRFIPISDIKNALDKGIGNKCDVERIISDYLQNEAKQKKIVLSNDSTGDECKEACEQDASDALKQVLALKKEQIEKDSEEYDISDYEDLLFYEPEDTMHPGLMKSLGTSFAFYNSLLEEDDFKTLMKKSPQERCEFLVARNRSILIRDKDWKKIFKDIRENEGSFARYYPMVRVKINSDDIGNMIKGIILNDALYAYCPILAEKYSNEHAEDEQ